MVGAAGIEPATACSQSRRAASALRSELAASPMPTATATMAAFLSGFRTNHRGPSPGNDQRYGLVAAGQEWSFSLHFRRPSLRGGVKSEPV